MSKLSEKEIRELKVATPKPRSGLYMKGDILADMEFDNCIYLEGQYCHFLGCRRECGIDDSCRVKREDAVPAVMVPRKLRDLIRESEGHMLFVDYGDERFSEEDLLEIETFVTVDYPSLEKAVSVDPSGKGEALITIYPEASRLVYDKRS